MPLTEGDERDVAMTLDLVIMPSIIPSMVLLTTVVLRSSADFFCHEANASASVLCSGCTAVWEYFIHTPSVFYRSYSMFDDFNIHTA